MRDTCQHLPLKVQRDGRADPALNKVWCWSLVTRPGLRLAPARSLLGHGHRDEATRLTTLAGLERWRDMSTSVGYMGRLIGHIYITKLNSVGHCSFTVYTDKLMVHLCLGHTGTPTNTFLGVSVDAATRPRKGSILMWAVASSWPRCHAGD